VLQNPILVLRDLKGLVILDEIHRMPELYEILRVLVDDPSCSLKFLVLGSSSPNIIRQVSETLAGRIGFVDMGGFNLREVSSASWKRFWLRGGFPRSFLAGDDTASFRWRENFTRTFLERDIPQLGFRIPQEAMRRFWSMLAHFHGQKWNSAEFARSLGTGEKTASSYLDILCGTFMVRKLQTSRELLGHVKVGASWERFAMEQILSVAGDRKAWFWGTHSGAEIDLLLDPEGINVGFEFKLSEAVRTTRSMHSALTDLSLKHLYIVYPGDDSYAVNDRISAVSISHLTQTVSALLYP